MARIHATALVDPKAELDADVEVGPYTVVGPQVRIGAGTTLGPHVVVDGHTTLGRRNRIFPFASIGLISQDRKYGGEPVTTTIGDENVVREYVSIHAGTAQDRADTRIGNGNWFLAYTHVAHDCHVGNHCVFSNNATLAGHVTVGDHVILSGFAGIDDARFKRQVVPGDALILESKFLKGMRDIGRWAVRATVDGQVACEATLLSVLRNMPNG